MTIKRILCPTDLSIESDEALRYALALTRAYEAKLIISHCTPDTSDDIFRPRLASLPLKFLDCAPCVINGDEMTGSGLRVILRTNEIKQTTFVA